MRLMFVTPAHLPPPETVRLCEEAWEGGADACQLRLKNSPPRELWPVARILVDAAARYRGRLIVNDRADVAAAAGAAGVQLGRDAIPVAAARSLLPPPALIGVSCHSVAEVLQAEAEGADYALLGTIFPTPSKNTTPLGVGELARACAKAKIPVLAIGGITVDNVGKVLSTGAAGVAVISAIADAPFPKAAARALADALASWRGEGAPQVDLC